jgi:competence protein ComEC
MSNIEQEMSDVEGSKRTRPFDIGHSLLDIRHFRRPGLHVWQAPLVPIALAATTGIVLDRQFDIPLPISLTAALACLLAFALHGFDSRRVLALLYLWTACAALGCAYHHWHITRAAPDDVRHLASEDGQPARLRGVIDSQPMATKAARSDPLRSFARKETTRFLLRVTAVQDLASRSWRGASGTVQVSAGGVVEALAGGDEIELAGRLALPEGPDNPGGFDYAAFLRDRRISALLSVRDAREVRVRGRGWLGSPWAWLALVRGWGQDVLTDAVPAPQGDLAAALLLGDSPGMTSDDWDLYLRTGVIHVLAISGQHLVVLAGFLWLALRLLRVRRRRGFLLVALLLLFYALVVGGRPPVMRSAWVVLAYAGGVLLQRPTHPANTFALAWLGVAIVNPADVFNAGCQLSFLAVAVLIWGVSDISELPYLFGGSLHGHANPQGIVAGVAGDIDPLPRLIEKSRSWPMRFIRAGFRQVVVAYLINALVWLAVTPLAASHFHLVSPVALLIGPPLVVLTSIALLTGFAVLLLAPLGAPLAWPFATATQYSLAGCTGLTQFFGAVPGAYFYVSDIPAWWLWILYATLLAGLGLDLLRRFPKPSLCLLLSWLGIGLVVLLWPHRPGEFRCTFLAVGHGGCIVMETPNGQTFLYDAGSIAGPDLTRRHVAPFLWQRGIRRIDEVFLSHADLDHFNGLRDLLERFAVARVTCTPSFEQRDMKAVRLTLAAIDRHGVPLRVVSTGDRWESDGLAIEVLHPPAEGPNGKENVRSMVLHMRHGAFSILLTGDLEEAGLDQVLAMPPRKVDVLMAPHHGSAKPNTPSLASWASPRLVVICQARTDDTREAARAYVGTNSAVYGTAPHGAIVVRSGVRGAWAETFRSGRRLSLSVDNE